MDQVLRTLFCSLIRPNLEYCTIVFNSISVHQGHRIEGVQHRFLKFIYRTLNCNTRVITVTCINYYIDLCDIYRIPPLRHRRIVNDCLFLYKCFHNHFSTADCNPFSLHVSNRRRVQGMHADEHILHVPRNRVEVTKRGFISRISSTYNGLHETCDVFGAPSSLNSFRTRVFRTLSSTSN